MILKKPFVSISVTTFNQKNYIKDCLDGILNQRTTFQFEIILGEDQSNDGTREVCQDYAKRYPEKIKLFLRSRKDVIYINGNATGRYNFLENLKACRGKYIALCEGDDYWMLRRLWLRVIPEEFDRVIKRDMPFLWLIS